MPDIISTAGLAVALFATTNIDDIFVLLGFLSDPKYRVSQIAVGQYIGLTILFAISVLASLISLVVAPAYIGLLGLAPIGIGLKKLWDLWQSTEDGDDAAPGRAGNNILAVIAVTAANGGDNISIYTPLFAIRSAREIVVTGIVFAVMAAVWLFVGYKLTSHPTLGAPIRRYGHRVVPFVLIGLGVMILIEAGSFGLLNR